MGEWEAGGGRFFFCFKKKKKKKEVEEGWGIFYELILVNADGWIGKGGL